MNFKGHPLYDELVRLGIVIPASVSEYYPRVRDREDVAVMRCANTGVIFLSRIDHVAANYYSEQEGLSYWSKEGREAGLQETSEDDRRRASAIGSLVAGKVYADVGTGLGGILDLVKTVAKEVHAVEPQRSARRALEALGYTAHASAAELAVCGTHFDVITLFHVFEHLVEPMAELERLYTSLAPGGTILIEVPHANDALLASYDLEAFKKFTFWGEHLILHTRKSLEHYLQSAGFENISVDGFQRYPLANHMYWLKEGKPGGQDHWSFLRDKDVEGSYARMLNKLDRTDTLIAVARKPMGA